MTTPGDADGDSGRPAAAAGGRARPGFAAAAAAATTRSRSARAISGLLDAEGWTLAAATGSVFGRWAQIVGPTWPAHTTPESLPTAS